MDLGIYQHYKGGFYLVIGIAEHTETGQTLVIYVSLDATREGLRMRARPMHGPDGFLVPPSAVMSTDPNPPSYRFRYVGLEVPQ